jgi:protein-disulfide isomerase
MSAPVVVIEYSDFQCPYCGRFARESWPALRRNYVTTKKVRWIYRYLPLAIHANARAAAEFAACAAQQGRFWELHDTLFARQDVLNKGIPDDVLSASGLDAAEARRCAAGANAARAVSDDLDHARALRLTATPSFLIGLSAADGTARIETVLNGAQPTAVFQRAIDALLEGRYETASK